jgi:GTP-binding protein
MLIDDVFIKTIAGNGGDGFVSFNKTKMSLGPVGGDGGQGGSIYVEGVSDIGALRVFRNQKVFKANNGEGGRGQMVHGKDGEDIILKVPVGTSIQNLSRPHMNRDILKVGQREVLVRGGKGGKGNFHFRSATNTSPQQFEEGHPGEEADFRLELKLIADVGLIGFPNAGKSSLLNMLTNSQSKVANYPFTTLEPHLGDYYGLILADIPGLIEGAGEGKGLGIKFLQHIDRTSILFHLVSALSDDVHKEYLAIRKELETYNPKFVDKEEYVFLSRSDEVSKEEVIKKLETLKKLNPHTCALSVIDDDKLLEVKKILNSIRDENVITS